MYFRPSPLRTPLTLCRGGGRFSLSGRLSWPLPSGLSPAVPTREPAAQPFLSPLSLSVLAYLGPRWDSPGRLWNGSGIGPGVEAEKRGASHVFTPFASTPAMSFHRLLLSLPPRSQHPSVPWRADVLGLISAAHTPEGGKTTQSHARPSRPQDHASYAPDLLKEGVGESQRIPIARRGSRSASSSYCHTCGIWGQSSRLTLPLSTFSECAQNTRGRGAGQPAAWWPPRMPCA